MSQGSTFFFRVEFMVFWPCSVHPMQGPGTMGVALSSIIASERTDLVVSTG